MSEIERLKDLINKNESRIAELGKSIEQTLNAFTQETSRIVEMAERINNSLEEADRRISGHEANILKLEEKRQGLRSETSYLEQRIKEAEKKISNLNSDVNSTSKDIMKMQEALKQYQSRSEASRAKLEKLERETLELHDNIETTNQANEKEFKDTNEEYTIAQHKINEIVDKEPIIDYLLNEASSEPPEIAIVAQLMKENGSASMDELKKVTRVPPAIAVRTINALEQKGILTKVSEENVKLEKS